MSFDWKEYLYLAEHMKKKADDFPNKEACHRSIISRSYYSAFCLTRNYINDNDGKSFSTSEHMQIQEYLIGSNKSERNKIGNQLKQLHQDRVKADYYNILSASYLTMSDKSLVTANKIVSALESIS